MNILFHVFICRCLIFRYLRGELKDKEQDCEWSTKCISGYFDVTVAVLFVT